MNSPAVVDAFLEFNRLQGQRTEICKDFEKYEIDDILDTQYTIYDTIYDILDTIYDVNTKLKSGFKILKNGQFQNGEEFQVLVGYLQLFPSLMRREVTKLFKMISKNLDEIDL